MQEAVKTKAISEIDYLQAQSDYGEALAAYEEARSQLSLANIDLSYCIVKAPFTGRISRNMVDPGNMVGTDASNSALATIYKDNQMYLYFNMAYPDFARLPKNTPSALPVTIQDVNNPERLGSPLWITVPRTLTSTREPSTCEPLPATRTGNFLAGCT